MSELDTELAFGAGADSVGSWQIGSLNVDPQVVMPLIPSIVRFNWGFFRDAKVTALRDAASNLRQTIEELQRSIDGKSPLTQCDEQVQNAQFSLSDDLTSFFRNVELYRDGVFSHTTKESISTLGIGAQLDALEREFTEKDKASFTTRRWEKLFPNFSRVSAKALTSFELHRAVRPLGIASKELRFCHRTFCR